ncbi:MAG: histidine phosphatase family protein, partial [Candidatus Mcinerneyibacterium aminivorans]
MEIYFVRHGETKGNKEKKFRGRTDYPLNENGKNQAKKLKEKLKKYKFDKLLTSPLKRAHETAKIIKPEGLEV